MLDPIAYTYDADYHCPDCTRARFGTDENHPWPPETAQDSEGNPLGAVAPWDEWYDFGYIAVQVLSCSDCGRELDRYEPWDLIEEAARKEGYEAGVAAGTWLLDGNSTEDDARTLLQGLEDGDPAVLESLPSSPLSGEWADAPLPRDVLEPYGMTDDDDAADDILSAYEDGYDEGVIDEAERSARAMLAGDNAPKGRW